MKINWPWYFGMLLLYLARHSDMIDPMNDYDCQGFNPMQIPCWDNLLYLIDKGGRPARPASSRWIPGHSISPI